MYIDRVYMVLASSALLAAPPYSYTAPQSHAGPLWISQSLTTRQGSQLFRFIVLHPTASTVHSFFTWNSTGPTFVNSTLSPSFNSLPVQKAAQPFVKEQNVALPYVCVAAFTFHAFNGP